MTIDEFQQLLSYIKENNSWEKFYEVAVICKRKLVKYVDAVFDSRDGRIFSVTFRQGGKSTSFCIESKKDLDAVYSWLDELVGSAKT